MVLVTTDPKRQRVVLRGERFQLELSWSQAALLATVLNEKSREVEPVLPFGRTMEFVAKD